MALKTPVVFLVFNRPELTARVFAEIRRARPERLLIVADGPRAGRVGEAERCAQVREIVAGVDWSCEVETDFSEVNLGCRRRVSSGLDWAFEHVDHAIILEDDCLPDPGFFGFCEPLLERYADDPRVMHIAGSCVLPDLAQMPTSYVVSHFPFIWGWATWRRAWKQFDLQMSRWPEFLAEDGLGRIFADRADVAIWSRMMAATFRGEVDTWDAQWVLAVWLAGGMSLVSTSNLISNLGFGKDATHTVGPSPQAALPTRAPHHPLVHPATLVFDPALDDRFQRTVFRPRRTVIDRIWNRLKRVSASAVQAR
jgi:hypothetical protein